MYPHIHAFYLHYCYLIIIYTYLLKRLFFGFVLRARIFLRRFFYFFNQNELANYIRTEYVNLFYVL